MQYTLGLDIGGTKCAVLLGSTDVQNAILHKTVFPTGQGPAQTIRLIFDAMDALLRENKVDLEDVCGMGISCGGPLSEKSGVILGPPNLYGWDHVPIVDILRERYPIPIRLDNDANACAVAEWKFGAAQGCASFIFLTFGTGLGAGIILDGRLYTGANGMAGEVGHMRLADFGPVGYGKAGSFEGFCSGNGIAQLAQQMALEHIQRGERPGYCPTVEALPAVTAKSVADAADAGDALARQVYAVCGEYLGRGLAVLVDILNPEMIVLGSIFFRSEHLLRPAMERSLARESHRISLRACKVVPAALGENIGDYAALSLALL